MRPTARHDRYDYSPIDGRRDYAWPNGARLAVYIAVNLECFSFGEGLGAELAPGGPQPDVLNYAWRDYGNRVGAFRLVEMLDKFAMPASVLINSDIYRQAPGLAEAFRARGDEFVGHGRTNSERQGILDEAAERALIAEATDNLTRSKAHAQGVGSARGFRKAARRPTCSRSWVIPTRSTGAWTINPSGCERSMGRYCPFPIRRKSTTFRRSSREKWRGRRLPG